jgi:hypothetical protein
MLSVERFAVVEFHVRPQLDRHGLAVLRGVGGQRELRHDLQVLVNVEQLVADRREHDAPHIGARERRVEHVRILGQPDPQRGLRGHRSATQRDKCGSRRETHGFHGCSPLTRSQARRPD